MIAVDTSDLLAALFRDQRRHADCARVLTERTGPFLLSPFVLAELDYLVSGAALLRRAFSAHFIGALLPGRSTPPPLEGGSGPDTARFPGSWRAGDRMELAGAHWRPAGAEAVLKLRALRASGDFDEYWAFHETPEYERNHPRRYAGGVVPPVAEPPPPPSPPRLRRVNRSARAMPLKTFQGSDEKEPHPLLGRHREPPHQ